MFFQKFAKFGNVTDIFIKMIHSNMGPELPQEYTFIQLRNMGSTCFINAVLQSFFAIDTINYFCFQYDNIQKKYPQLQSLTEKTRLYLFVKIYIDSQNAPQNEVLYEPTYFLDSIFTDDSPFRRGEQSDSHEFILFILNSFDQDILKINEIIHKDDCLPLFSSLFTGTYETAFCALPNFPFSFESEKFTYLSIFASDIELGLEKWKRGEDIQEHYRNIIIQRKILKFPQILLIQSPVFSSGTLRKQMNLRPLFTITISGTKYNLKSIIVHIGHTMYTGHYVCFYAVNFRWVYADDENMRPLNHEEYHKFFGNGFLPSEPTATAYVLLYEREVN